MQRLGTAYKGFGYAVLLALALIICRAAPLTASAWRLCKNQWSEQDERVYSDFVAAIGKSKYSNLNKFIRCPKANPLYGEEDQKLNLTCDCADLPYVIRAYVAYKLRLPFSYTSAISGGGGDERYSRGNKPVEFKDQDYFKSPQQLFNYVKLVNSGYYRTAASSEQSDFYPVKINKSSIVPGTVYYDPDGHVALVSEVTSEGRIRLIDAHPDKTISKPWFGAKFSRGNKKNGGGFKYWRPVFYTALGHTVRTKNHNIQNYSSEDQFQKNYTISGGGVVSYYDYIRFSLAESGAKLNPINEFVFMMNDIYEDIKYRALAVDICIENGINKRPHPGALPWNIYGTSGVWEEFSTPSRDARLKVAFRDFYDRARQLVIQASAGSGGSSGARALAMAFLQKYNELSPRLAIFYTNSAGQRVGLSFNDVCLRLFNLSFDPYHSIELRWGEPLYNAQNSTDSELKRRFYALEATLRNRLERVYNISTPLAMGPKQPPCVDICTWLADFLNRKQVDTTFMAFNRETVGAVCQNQAAEKPQLTASLPSLGTEKPKQCPPVFELPLPNAAQAEPLSPINAALAEKKECENGDNIKAELSDEPNKWQAQNAVCSNILAAQISDTLLEEGEYSQTQSELQPQGLKSYEIEKLPDGSKADMAAAEPKTGLSLMFAIGDGLADALMNKNNSFMAVKEQNDD